MPRLLISSANLLHPSPICKYEQEEEEKHVILSQELDSLKEREGEKVRKKNEKNLCVTNCYVEWMEGGCCTV